MTSAAVLLNNPKLSKLQFDSRNTELHALDDGLLEDYDNGLKEAEANSKYNLTIFHLMGQHVDYKTRYKQGADPFLGRQLRGQAPRADRQAAQGAEPLRQCHPLQRLHRGADREAYSKKETPSSSTCPTMARRCYEGNRGFICRNHSANIDWPLAHYEFEIPFWIYCSPKYISSHRDIYTPDT